MSKSLFHISVDRFLMFLGLMMISMIGYGQDFELKNGVNIQASYYNQGRVNIGWELMKSYPEIGAVRIEIEPNRAEQAKTWIKEAHENGYQVIATYHRSRKLGSDDTKDLMDAVEWWSDHYLDLSATGPIIINVMNEWGSHVISSEDYASAYNEAISELRTFYSGQLIVDVPGFGQATKIAADAYELILDEKITFSIHIYRSAFNEAENRWLTQDDLTYLDETGADCIVGEFCDNIQGGADWCSIIDDCYSNGWPLFGWTWNGDGKNMNMIEPHWRDEPLATSFQPSEFMDVIISKLRGESCYTSPDEDCEDEDISRRCDDGNEYTVNDIYNEYCHCTGEFTNTLASNTSESDLIIYPNPIGTNEELSIEFFKINSRGTIHILNNMGQVMLTESVALNQGKLVLGINTLQNGLYWVMFFTDEEVVVTRSFVVR